IRINHSVVATIVKLAAIEVEGVLQVGGGGFVDDMVGMFKKKESGSGINVDEDEAGNYLITIRLVVAYGAKLDKTASDVQIAVRDQILQMTNKPVAKVHVVIEGIKIQDRSSDSSVDDTTQGLDDEEA